MRTCPNGHKLKVGYDRTDYAGTIEWIVFCANDDCKWIQGEYLGSRQAENSCEYNNSYNPFNQKLAEEFNKLHNKAVWDYANELFHQETREERIADGACDVCGGEWERTKWGHQATCPKAVT